jgi:hypothetical protein
MKTHRIKFAFLLAVVGLVAALISSGAPADNSGTSALYAVQAVASNDVWAAGYRYQGNFSFPLVEHWDGTSWTMLPNPAGDVWTVGQAYASPVNQTLALHWNGTGWSQAVTPNIGRGILANSLYAVSAVASNDVWAVGIGQQAMTLHWDGRRWRIVPNPAEH